jgi:hypothetical protein
MRWLTVAILASLALARPAAAQTEATARLMDAARENPGFLLAFLREMPKGADLHSHLSGAVYAETFIGWAVEKNACIQLESMRSVAAPCDSARGTVPAANALRDNNFHDAIIDAWSMRNWSRALKNGHDQFFGTFAKFGYAGAGRSGDMLIEVTRRAAANRVSYLELMYTPDDGSFELAGRVGWEADFTRMRERLNAAGHAAVVAAARRDFADLVAHQRSRMGCATSSAEPACGVPVRFLYQVLRSQPPEIVFTQIMTAFETAARDSLVVGFNLVMPEDWYFAMRDFSLHMRIIDYLKPDYPGVKVSLHAGELTRGLVPPEGLRFHIRESIQKGHASRIGHGVAIMYEDNALETLQQMARQGIAVEICLTSNDAILNVSGREHPLAIYHAHGVPTLLATDDEGVNRSEMTMEYLKAVREHGLDYITLKTMAHNSLRHAFVRETVKSQLLAQLERDFAAFEAKWSALSPLAE